MNNRFGTLSNEATFRWLSPEEFRALSATEKDIYIYAVFAVIKRELYPKSGKQDSLEQN